MTAAPRQFPSTIKWILTISLIAGPIAFVGCSGDNPGGSAGTIEMPARTVTPASDAKAFDPSKANPKAATP